MDKKTKLLMAFFGGSESDWKFFEDFLNNLEKRGYTLDDIDVFKNGRYVRLDDMYFGRIVERILKSMIEMFGEALAEVLDISYQDDFFDEYLDELSRSVSMKDINQGKYEISHKYFGSYIMSRDIDGFILNFVVFDEEGKAHLRSSAS